MKKSTGLSYRKRLTAVIDYIYSHLDGDLDVNRLADVATMSPYHFHRIYREIAQEPVNVTVRRLRLQHAASELIRTQLSLQTIARNVAYGSLEAFSRAFTKQFGETPSEYRQSRHLSKIRLEPFVAILPETETETVAMYDVEVITNNEINLIGYEHVGDYMEIGKEFERIAHYACSHNLFNQNTRSIGIYYHDPKSIEKEDLRSIAGLSVPKSPQLDEEDAPKYYTIPSGRCARLVFKGSYAELEKPYDWLFGKWLPASGYEAADFPPFEEYLNDPRTTPPNELLTRIHCLLA
ncbi:AraC family transcriptional regulator [Agarilytica rhodophyticola]|uniref:AraC family transcriptional regulator n=1 Tax=Agarilytica rhodophyticola TaxID=1737490 RepID=UPI000B3478DB|nr:AraC family transcriptional regulator [Agarilytica rhodophyticola]